MTANLDILKDKRVNCYSVMVQMSIEDYLKSVKEIFKDRGGLEGQRDTLKTTTAIRIRKRMVEDIQAGTVLPPIVLGLIITNEEFSDLNKLEDQDSFLQFIEKKSKEEISIIDGMQRTTALIEASEHADIGSKNIRVEYWIASQINSLTYRMLVLNTGQVPWNIRRQIEVVFKQIIKELKIKVPNITIMELDETGRRSDAGQFQANKIIELFLVFGARKEKIDIQERLADEFTKQDFIESIANPDFTDIFYEVIKYLIKFDQIFSSYKNEEIEEHFKEGKDLFTSQPACVGFVTAIALSVLGRPGLDYPSERQNQKWNEIKNNADELLQQLDSFNSEEIGTFLDFTTLNELIRQKSGKASHYERTLFLQAFKVMIEEQFKLENMTPCWRAY